MTYAYRKAEESDSESIYQLYRLAMQGFISEIWGWNEPWQRADFSSHFDHQGIMLAWDAPSTSAARPRAATLGIHED